MEGCESPPAFYKSTNGSNIINWDEPEFHDNSMEPVNVCKINVICVCVLYVFVS